MSHYTQFSFKRKVVLYTALFCLKNIVLFPILVIYIKDCSVLYVRILLYEKFCLLEANWRTPRAQWVRLASTYTATCKRIQPPPVSCVKRCGVHPPLLKPDDFTTHRTVHEHERNQHVNLLGAGISSGFS